MDKNEKSWIEICLPTNFDGQCNYPIINEASLAIKLVFGNTLFTFVNILEGPLTSIAIIHNLSLLSYLLSY